MRDHSLYIGVGKGRGPLRHHDWLTKVNIYSVPARAGFEPARLEWPISIGQRLVPLDYHASLMHNT